MNVLVVTLLIFFVGSFSALIGAGGVVLTLIVSVSFFLLMAIVTQQSEIRPLILGGTGMGILFGLVLAVAEAVPNWGWVDVPAVEVVAFYELMVLVFGGLVVVIIGGYLQSFSWRQSAGQTILPGVAFYVLGTLPGTIGVLGLLPATVLGTAGIAMMLFLYAVVRKAVGLPLRILG